MKKLSILLDKTIKKAYVVALIFAILLITNVHAESNYDLGISKMTIIAPQVAYSTASSVAAALDTNIQWSTVNFNASSTGFSGHAQFQMSNGQLLSESLTGSYSPGNTTTYKVDSVFSNHTVTTNGYINDNDIGAYYETADSFDEIGEILFHLVGTGALLFVPQPWGLIGHTALFLTMSSPLNPDKTSPYTSDWLLQYSIEHPLTADMYGSFGGQPAMHGTLNTSSGTGTIPEPATICLLCLGGLSILRRRKTA